MGRADHLILGDWNAVCYQCGFKRFASQMEKNWQGYWVCPEHNEPRQTQDFVRAIPDIQTVPWSQPQPGITYTYTNATIGFGDGVTTKFQFGSGLNGTEVGGLPGPDAATDYFLTEIRVNNIVVSGVMDPFGVITLTSPPALGARVTATGWENVV